MRRKTIAEDTGVWSIACLHVEGQRLALANSLRTLVVGRRGMIEASRSKSSLQRQAFVAESVFEGSLQASALDGASLCCT